MKVDLFPFQRTALAGLRMYTAEALGAFGRTHSPQVVSFTAPTGAGKTIIMAALIESIFCGDDKYPDQREAIIVWLSDSPQLNKQSCDKIYLKADKINWIPKTTVTDSSFDQPTFSDGHIYFLNTQKLSKTSNLTNTGDGRTFTIWQTLANTAREKSNRLYVIIDEAHRGMQGREAGKATTIMQKFLKGSKEDYDLPPMPVVIGMSATPARFNHLVEGTTSTIHKVIVEPKDVRASGLLKDRIVISYPEESTVNKDMAVLQAAADDWQDKCLHWEQYCREQHYAYVKPIFVIQVQNGTGGKLSDTDLDDILRKITERTELPFNEWQVRHTFGQAPETITINGVPVHHIEAKDIAGNENVRVVLFKESLSTGWDCPRAETMMSFRRATDATYIAQLLGRMVRTPMQMRIQVDDTLNAVHLLLPHFDESTVKEVVESLQNAEGGEIPTDIYGETIGKQKYTTLTVHHKPKPPLTTPTETPATQPKPPTPTSSLTQQETTPLFDAPITQNFPSNNPAEPNTPDNPPQIPSKPSPTVPKIEPATSSPLFEQEETTKIDTKPEINPTSPPDLFDREEIMRYINDAGLLSYDVRSVQISDYLSSLMELSQVLNHTEIYHNAIVESKEGITQIIHGFIEELKSCGEYEKYVHDVKEFKLFSQIFNVYGESIDQYTVHDLFSTADTDIDRQFQLAENKLKKEGLANYYIQKYDDESDINALKIDVIIAAASEDCLNKIHAWAKDEFHRLNDKYRRKFATIKDERTRKEYDKIVSNGDIVSKHNFRLPETIQVNQEGGTEYRSHLFVDSETGTAKLNLNTWEHDVIAEEEKRTDFVCFIRNISRAAWALCIPYEIDGTKQGTYPDFLIVRRDPDDGYIIDILEPHRGNEKDNLGKAKGFAEYARENPGIGRIQLIRQIKDDITGKARYKRLDMSKGQVRDKVLHCINNDELDQLFKKDGFFDN